MTLYNYWVLFLLYSLYVSYVLYIIDTFIFQNCRWIMEWLIITYYFIYTNDLT